MMYSNVVGGGGGGEFREEKKIEPELLTKVLIKVTYFYRVTTWFGNAKVSVNKHTIKLWMRGLQYMFKVFLVCFSVRFSGCCHYSSPHYSGLLWCH